MTEYVRVKPDLHFPRTIEGRTEEGQFPWIVHIVASWNDETLSYDIGQLSLTRHSKDADVSPPINGRTIRNLRIQEAFKDVVDREVKLDDGSPYVPPFTAKIRIDNGKVQWVPQEGAVMAREVPLNKAKAEEERLKEASRIHAVARAFGEPPMKLVGTVFGVSATAVTRLMNKAREAGWSE